MQMLLAQLTARLLTGNRTDLWLQRFWKTLYVDMIQGETQVLSALHQLWEIQDFSHRSVFAAPIGLHPSYHNQLNRNNGRNLIRSTVTA